MSKDKQRVGSCPRCGYPIWADVELDVSASKPFLGTDDQRWRVSASVNITSVRVEHSCSSEDEGPFDSVFDGLMDARESSE